MCAVLLGLWKPRQEKAWWVVSLVPLSMPAVGTLGETVEVCCCCVKVTFLDVLGTGVLGTEVLLVNFPPGNIATLTIVIELSLTVGS